jgi:argininosuccinate lyase
MIIEPLAKDCLSSTSPIMPNGRRPDVADLGGVRGWGETSSGRHDRSADRFSA